jgi:PAT family beta-lactamase induction signal transducer AmpG
LRSEGVDLKTIGFFALIQFPYTWKFLWSPLLDRYSHAISRPPARLDACSCRSACC